MRDFFTKNGLQIMRLKFFIHLPKLPWCKFAFNIKTVSRWLRATNFKYHKVIKTSPIESEIWTHWIQAKQKLVEFLNIFQLSSFEETNKSCESSFMIGAFFKHLISSEKTGLKCNFLHRGEAELPTTCDSAKQKNHKRRKNEKRWKKTW